MIITVKQRLEKIGYEFTESDDFILNFLIEKVETVIKNNCNISEIPDELKSIAVDMVVGYFLKEKKSTAIETILGLDLTAIQSIREGDTSVTFANATPEQKLDKMIDYLIFGSEKTLVSYRCMKW